ncbi:MAG: lysophospholipid acyltransferase family protein [Eubacteriales bacterium]|nr:lysophospholipid acyltransferase family protein [Eubacteriales bacterium]
MKILKNIPFILWFCICLLRMGGIRRKIEEYRQSGDAEKEIIEIRKAEDFWGPALCSKAGIKINVSGLEHIPDGPVVFVSNHQSYFDIPVFFTAIKNKQIGFVAKQELRKIPLFGAWTYRIRSIFIEREDARASLKAFEEAGENLEKGFSMVICPEGTRSKASKIGEFKKGSIRLATKAKVPVVPVSLDGTYHAYEERGVFSPAVVDFVIHPAIETKDLSKKEITDLSDQVEAIIRKGFEEIMEKKR